MRYLKVTGTDPNPIQDPTDRQSEPAIATDKSILAVPRHHVDPYCVNIMLQDDPVREEEQLDDERGSNPDPRYLSMLRSDGCPRDNPGCDGCSVPYVLCQKRGIGWPGSRARSTARTKHITILIRRHIMGRLENSHQ